jgi:hypothetical protein
MANGQATKNAPIKNRVQVIFTNVPPRPSTVGMIRKSECRFSESWSNSVSGKQYFLGQLKNREFRGR